MKSLLTALLMSPMMVEASGFYRLVDQFPQGNERHQIEAFLSDLEAKLPAKLKTQFPQGIPVKFQEMGKSHGRATKGTVFLASKIIPHILRGEETSLPSYDPAGKVRTHKTEFREAQATVLHETAHLYDFKNVRTAEEQAFISHCQMVQYDREMVRPDGCELYFTTKTTLSSDPYYLEVAGWPLSVQGENHREKNNIFSKRTADTYEFEDGREHFAVNFEYFLLDPEFGCRKPTLAAFFESHFRHRPFERYCESWSYVDPSVPKAEELIKEIPFDRVYQIHYLHAAKGQEMMSRWGHSMYRVVICAPERTKLGPDCMRDEYYHLVLSYRAFVGTYGIETWKGLTGQYPSRLFFLPLEEVKQNYIIDEFRDVYSYPLNLTRNEMKSFLKRALETHWNYESSYYFLSNNCATESLGLLRSSILRPGLMDKKIIRPTDLLNVLVQQQLVDLRSIPKDPVEAFNQGLLFINHSDHFIKALSEITGSQQSVKSVVAHLDAPFEARKKTYGRSDTADIKELAAQVILESAALDRAKNRASSGIFESALAAAKSGQANRLVEDLKNSFDRSVQLFNVFSAPYELLSNDTYGVPLKSELVSTQNHIQKLWQESRENSKSRKEKIKNQMTDSQKAEITATENNLQEVTQAMITLHSKKN